MANEPTTGDVVLCRTRLSIEAGSLVHRSKNGDELLCVPLGAIESVEFIHARNIFGSVMTLLAAGIIATSLRYAQDKVIEFLLYAAGVLVAACGVSTFRYDAFLIQTGQATLRIAIQDIAEDAVDFIARLRPLCPGWLATFFAS